MAVLAICALATPGSSGNFSLSQGGDEASEIHAAPRQAMGFEQPGMSFPGSAFFYIADLPQAPLINLPSSDPLAQGGDASAETGTRIDNGPAARPFMMASSSPNLGRAAQCLAQAIWYEAASESEAGQRAVAQVVLNRAAHPAWPSSVCGVVYQGSTRRTGCQFSFTCDGSLRRQPSGQGWERARLIAADALAGSVYEPVGLATHYHTLWVSPRWAASLENAGTIGAHRFYRLSGARGRSSAFAQQLAASEPNIFAEQNSPISIMPASQPPSRVAPNPPRPIIKREALLETSEPSDEAIEASGKARAQYADAGRWKVDPRSVGITGETGAVNEAGETLR